MSTRSLLWLIANVVVVGGLFWLVLSADQERLWITVGNDKIQSLQKGLSTELKTTLQAEGHIKAIAVCNERAPMFASILGSDDQTVRRIGTRARNQQSNRPTERELEILADFAALPEAERKDAFHIERDDERWAMYKPIWIGKPICLTCHGSKESMDPALRAELARLYPDDEATGYQLGELRGAFVVENRRKSPQQD